LKKNEQLLVLYFKVDDFVGIPEPLERKKFRDVVWFAADHLPDGVSKATRHVIERLQAGEIYSEFPSRTKVLLYWGQFAQSWQSGQTPDLL
jgi:hypothetical protein